MPRNVAPSEQNTFVAGLSTEASPLTFPQNASLDEENFILSRKGSRARRLGMDLEDRYVIVDSGITIPTDNELHITSFKWQNIGGDASKTIIVVQIAYKLHFFIRASTQLSAGFISTCEYDPTASVGKFYYVEVDVMWVVVTGRKY